MICDAVNEESHGKSNSPSLLHCLTCSKCALVFCIWFLFTFMFTNHVHTATAPTSDMNDVTEALYHTVADKCEHIGIYLHLPMAALKTIAAEHQHDSHKCLIGMLGGG